MDSLDFLLTASEAAKLLGLKISTIRRLTSTGKLPTVRPTGKRAVRYSTRALEDLIRLRSMPMLERNR
jgi:excisionase family DNA binding protein